MSLDSMSYPTDDLLDFISEPLFDEKVILGEDTNYPKISIVTPSYNQGQYLEQTILSVLNQNYPNLEYIIIDGGSSDNCLQIIKKYEKYLKYWISEPDSGQSHAINKGIEIATGDIFNWINSDDLLNRGALFKVAKAFTGNQKIKCFGGKLYRLSDDNNKVTFDKLNDLKNKTQIYCDPVMNQQAMFYRMEAVSRMGQLNTRLHYCMDYEWWLKFLFLFGEKAAFFSPEYLAVFRLHRESKNRSVHVRFLDDIANILYSLAHQFNLRNYCNTLQVGYKIYRDYAFNLELANESEELIKKMIIYFLLKWNNIIYQKRQYNCVKAMLKNIDLSDVALENEELEKLHRIKKQIKLSTWFMFRVNKKIAHFRQQFL
jgi:glycosyltransferase involved in cell wall biosynthesis